MKNTILFSSVAEKFMEYKSPLVKPTTLCAYKLILYVHLLPAFGGSVHITEEEVQSFLIAKLASGLSHKSVRNIVMLLRSVIRFGGRHCDFPDDPWEIKFPTDTRKKPLPVLPIAHHRRLMRWLADNPDPDNIGIMIALSTGMRLGEVLGLRWSDVDMQQRTITVSRTLSCIYNVSAKSTGLTFTAPKTQSSNREIPISGNLLNALRSIRGRGGQDCYVVGGCAEPKNPRNYREYYARLLATLRIPYMKFHGLRHTFATRCIESQCDYKTVSSILGHASVAITMNLYVHPNQDQKKRCMDRMAKYLGA